MMFNVGEIVMKNGDAAVMFNGGTALMLIICGGLAVVLNES